MIITQEVRDEIHRLMEYYKNNPSNANKAYHSMLALFEDEKVWKEDENLT